jgi:hypothetical protein
MATDLKPLTIIVRGEHDMGKTTIANLIRTFLEDNDFRDVKVIDVDPLLHDQKARWWDRFQRNRERPIHIRVELVEG